MTIEVHCQNCGEFLEAVPHGQIKNCPRCGDDQAIILPYLTPERFDWETRQKMREGADGDGDDWFSAEILRGLNR